VFKIGVMGVTPRRFARASLRVIPAKTFADLSDLSDLVSASWRVDVAETSLPLRPFALYARCPHRLNFLNLITLEVLLHDESQIFTIFAL
jgi:hypothetical protein